MTTHYNPIVRLRRVIDVTASRALLPVIYWLESALRKLEKEPK